MMWIGGELIQSRGSFLHFGMLSVLIGMGMNSGAITGDRKGIRRGEATLNGRDDSNMVKKLLEPGFKVEGDIFFRSKGV